MKSQIIPLIVAALFVSAPACQEKPAPVTSQSSSDSQAPQAADTAAPGIPPGGGLSGTVSETMDASGYTYVQVDTGTEKIWAAAPKFEVAVGEKVTIPEGVGMPNYHSDSLDRDFDMVYFVATVIKGDGTDAGLSPEGALMGQADAVHPPPSAAADVSFSGIKKPEGGKTVEEVWKSKDDLGGKEVSVRGKVVKFNSMVMGKNWIHVQDGTGGQGTNDLTVTTMTSAAVGDTVVVTGVLTLNKDFGFGYKYDVLLEDAKVSVE